MVKNFFDYDEIPKRKEPSEFAFYCLDLIQNCGAVGPCDIRRMMSGWVIGIDGYTFAILIDLGEGEELYLKTDSETEPVFKSLGSSKFSYFITFNGNIVPRSLNYYTAPPESLENHESIRSFVEMALMTSLKKGKPKKKSKRKLF